MSEENEKNHKLFFGAFIFCALGIIILFAVAIQDSLQILEAIEKYKELKTNCPCWISNNTGFNPTNIPMIYDNGTAIWDFINKTRS